MESIKIEFGTSNLGRIMFYTKVLTGDFKSTKDVEFKLDSGSDFTTISCESLYDLGYSDEFLKKCPFHHDEASAAGTNTMPLQYISNVSIKFGDRELQGCRIFFALGTKLRSLFGTDILKYFNWDINYDKGIFRLTETEVKPQLSRGEEQPIQIYSLESLIQLKS